jgi:hypothetical protein
LETCIQNIKKKGIQAMMFNNITKIQEGEHAMNYMVSSPECPDCKTVLTIMITPPQLWQYNQGELIQDVIPEVSYDDRERFLSGYCVTCWDAMFPPSDDDEDDDLGWD